MTDGLPAALIAVALVVALCLTIRRLSEATLAVAAQLAAFREHVQHRLDAHEDRLERVEAQQSGSRTCCAPARGPRAGDGNRLQFGA